MPRYLIKTAPDKDLYIYWSTITDSPLGAGDRKTLEAALLIYKIEELKEEIGRAFDRADMTVGDEAGEVCGQKWLPSENYTALAERLSVNPDADFDDLLQPLED